MSDLSRISEMTPEDAAALWLVKQDQGLDVVAYAPFASWLDASAAHREAWTKAQRLWSDFDGPDDLLGASMRQAALAARPERRPAIGWAVAAAAVLAVLIFTGVGWEILKPARPGKVETLIATNAKPDYATDVGVQTMVSLPDGTGVLLDTNSAIAVRFSPGRRSVRLLRGRAYFTVVHNAAAPFVVAADDRTVTDLGTAFAMARVDGALSVTLAEGSVAVGGRDRQVTLRPGQQLVGKRGQDDAVTAVDLTQMLAWRTGFLEFHDELLGQAVAEMNRYGATPVTVPDPATAALRISGRFHTGDPVRFAQALAEIYPVRLKGSGGVEIHAVP